MEVRRMVDLIIAILDLALCIAYIFFLRKSKSENKLDKVANILGAVAAACFGLGAICNFAMYFLG